MRYISIFIISLFFITGKSQDSLSTKESKKKYDFHLGIGTDLVEPVSGLFSDRSGYSILIDLQLFRQWFVQTQFGYAQNGYEDIGWNVKAKGSFLKLGGNYIITSHKKNPLNQFYVGAKIAYTRFTQDLEQVPIRALGQTTQYVDLGEDKAHVYWLEFPVGARVSILKEKLYAEAIFSTNILLHQVSEIGVDPLVIPNFGKNNNGLNFNLFWGISYFIK